MDLEDDIPIEKALPIVISGNDQINAQIDERLRTMIAQDMDRVQRLRIALGKFDLQAAIREIGNESGICALACAGFDASMIRSVTMLQELERDDT